jgi:hypothetical protein
MFVVRVLGLTKLREERHEQRQSPSINSTIWLQAYSGGVPPAVCSVSGAGRRSRKRSKASTQAAA